WPSRGGGRPVLESARDMGVNRPTVLLRTLLARPDEVMLELGAGGELLVARLRAALSALILLLPLVGAVSGAEVGETVIGLAAAVFVNIMAQVWLALARHRRQYAWLPYATCTYDISTTDRKS